MYAITCIYPEGDNATYLYATKVQAKLEAENILKDMEEETIEDTPFQIETKIENYILTAEKQEIMRIAFSEVCDEI